MPAQPRPELALRLEVEIVAPHEEWGRHDGLDQAIEGALQAAARAAGLEGDAEVTVVLADDATQRGLNAAWRGKDAPTNVLSFPATLAPAFETRILGDIVLAYETVAREAEAGGKTLEAHVAHLAVHGLLHLAGFDHENDTQAATMEGLETRILAGLGFDDPYSEKGLPGGTHG